MKQLMVFLMLSACLGACKTNPEKEDVKVDQPNIIFILVDDLGYGDIGCFGQKKIQTPNIDQLASEGIRFTQAYAGNAVCAPCRSTPDAGLALRACKSERQ